MISRLLHFIYIFYCFEVGIFLIVFPWFSIWENNIFILQFPWIKNWVLSGYARGAITGLGISNLILGVIEITHLKRGQSHPPVVNRTDPALAGNQQETTNSRQTERLLR